MQMFAYLAHSAFLSLLIHQHPLGRPLASQLDALRSISLMVRAVVVSVWHCKLYDSHPTCLLGLHPEAIQLR